jgi:hypothetical protein
LINRYSAIQFAGWAVSLLLPLALYAAFVYFPLPAKYGLLLRYDAKVTLLLAAVAACLAFSPKGRLGTMLGLGLVLILFALPLSGLWARGVSEANIVSGLLPWMDASAFYRDAQRLLEGGLLSSFSARRPLFTGLLAFLLGLAQRNLQAGLAILVLINAVACYLLARQIQRTHGTLAGAATFILMFVFYRRFIGTALTENLGVALGCLGFALLWRGGWKGKLWDMLPGLLLLTLALAARAGAFFVLPLLVVATGWILRGAKRYSTRIALLALAAVGLGFLLNMLLFLTLASPNSVPFSNFPYVVYDMAVGGKGWTQVRVDHPEVNNLVEPEVSRKIMQLALDEIRRNPANLVSGVLKAYRVFLATNKNSIFGFFGGDKQSVALVGRILLLILSALGLGFSLFKRKEPGYLLLVMGAGGILLSVPFVPPWEADSMRAYAATMPFLAALPAVAVYFFISKVKPLTFLVAPRQIAGSDGLLILGSFMAILVIIGPVVTKMSGHPAQFGQITCPVGSEPIYARLSTGSVVHIVDDGTARQTWLPAIRFSDFETNIHDFGYSEVAGELNSLTLPATLANVMNLQDGDTAWLVVNTTLIPPTPRILVMCGKWSDGPGKAYHFFYAASVQEVSHNR